MRTKLTDNLQFNLLDATAFDDMVSLTPTRQNPSDFNILGVDVNALPSSPSNNSAPEAASPVFELSTLLAANGGDGSAGFVINGIDANDRSGQSVSNAGDVNGDGFDDIIIGASYAGSSYSGIGESYVVFGNNTGFAASFELSALNGTNGFMITGIDNADSSGRSVSSAGDINGDGIADILISAPDADPNGNSRAGESYVVFGSNAGFAANLDLSGLNGTNGFVINGIDADDYIGRSVSSAGDINNDGFDDIIIGSVGADPGGNSLAGESYVVFGSNAGFAASLDLSSLNGTNGFVVNGIDFQDFSGTSVSSAGDFNGDGIYDIIIGAPSADPNGSVSGESYVIFGKSSSFAASLNLSTLTGINGFVINGVDFLDRSGQSVSNAGDINGDGFDDIIIGAPYANPNGTSSGETYVVFGSNVNGASLDLSTLNGNNGFVINGIVANDLSGRDVSAAGDVNGDGFDDILIGASNADLGGDTIGQSYVVFGTDIPFPVNLDLSTLNGNNGFAINGIDDFDQSGWSVSAAGDVNGDGIDDILVGATLGDANGTNTGETYVIFGSTDFGQPIPGPTSGDDNLRGTSDDDTIDLLAGDDIYRGLGGADTIFGNTGEDTLLGQGGNDEINGGDGNDMLIGGLGDDVMNGDADNDFMNGQSGNDTMNGGTGDDEMRGAAGNDMMLGGIGNDDMNGGGGNDTVDGGDGDDMLNGSIGDDTIFGGEGDDTLGGGNQQDTLFGNNGNDMINGDAGNDIILGGDGNDVIVGASGADNLNGGNGNDSLQGDSGGDNLFGNSGQDILFGGGGNDNMTGGADADTYLQNLGFGTDRITDFEDGVDLIDFSSNGLVTNFADVIAAAFQTGSNVRIELNANNILVLENFDLSDLDASDFIF